MNLYSMILLIIVLFAAFIGYWCATKTIEDHVSYGMPLTNKQAALVYAIAIGCSISIVVCMVIMGELLNGH